MAQTALHPSVGGMQLLHSLEVERWIIDIPQDDISVATALYPRSMARLRETVLPLREEKAHRERIGNDEVRQRNPRARVNQHHQRFLEHWWKLAYRRADLIERLGSLDRYIAVARTSSEERLTVFEFVNSQVYPGDSVVAFAFSDDYTFGVLQSSLHRAWFEERCTTLETRLTYTEKTVWDCFPWPQDPSAAGVEGVVSAVSEIQEVRALLRGEGLSLAAMYDTLRTPGASALRQAHERLDAAVMDAYGFDDSDDPLAQLLALNLDVVMAEEHWEVVRGPGGQDLPGSRVTNYCWGS